MTALSLLPGTATGPVLATSEGLSFWGGVDPATARVIDVHHPLHGADLSGAILMMPTSRGSCTGSGVLLDMILQGRAPAALIFSEAEDVLTLGALVGAQMFGRPLPVLRVSAGNFARLAAQSELRIGAGVMEGGDLSLPVEPLPPSALTLSEDDRAMLDGQGGPAVQQAMAILTAMAAQQGAARLIDISRAHIDGCIYASPANLTFSQTMADLGGRVRVPSTMNAISVDHGHWRGQGVPASFGAPAQALADAYVAMGCEPTYTCSPYLLDDAPTEGEAIVWAESNAVIYANSVLGARTPKHPDFLDLCMALTGRAPEAGVYATDARRPRRIIAVDMPAGADDAIWPLLGYVAGKRAPDRIPLLTGLAGAAPGPEALKALCAAFGTTSAAPMLHVEGVTPEADLPPVEGADHARITRADLAEAWKVLNDGPDTVDLIAIGSPHASLEECRVLAEGLGEGRVTVPTILTVGRAVAALAGRDGTLDRLQRAGVRVIPDLCWCSISEPVFPPGTTAVLTNSGKYAHYGPGLSGRPLRFAGLGACVAAALDGGRVPHGLPDWLQEG